MFVLCGYLYLHMCVLCVRNCNCILCGYVCVCDSVLQCVYVTVLVTVLVTVCGTVCLQHPRTQRKKERKTDVCAKRLYRARCKCSTTTCKGGSYRIKQISVVCVRHCERRVGRFGFLRKSERKKERKHRRALCSCVALSGNSTWMQVGEATKH